MTPRRTIAEVAPLIQSGRLSPVALVSWCLERIERRAELNAFITVIDERALAEAADAEREISAGRYKGPLHGIPVSVKDLIDVAGTATTSGSAVPPRRPLTDAPVVQRLREAGAIIIGKTNLHEFAFGTTGEDTAFGAIRNPHDPSRSAGGSSSGAAVALVEGMCLASLGTDTGGSIRIPAAACGTVGLKPAFGEVPTEGVVPLSYTCDHVGPLTNSVEDSRVVLEIISGAAVPRRAGVQPLTFAVPTGYLLERLDAGVRDALGQTRKALVGAGHRVQDIDLDAARMTPDVYLHIVLPEASAHHALLLEQHAGAYSPNVRLRLEMGRYVLAEDYVRAMRLRSRLTDAVDAALNACDALLLPALAIPAPPLGATTVELDGATEPVRAIMLRLTQVFNLTGHPAIALPAGTVDALPVGMQLVGRRGGTARLLEIAEAIEPLLHGGDGAAPSTRR